MVVLIIIAVLLLFVLWILVTPLVLYINTENGVYYIKLTNIVKAQLLLDDKAILIRITVFFIRFNIDPFKLGKKRQKKKGKKSRRKKKRLNTIRDGGKLMKGILKSFRVRLFRIDIDTGNIFTNSFLVPAGFLINNNNIQLSSNYLGENSVEIEIQNRLIKTLFVFIRSYTGIR